VCWTREIVEIEESVKIENWKVKGVIKGWELEDCEKKNIWQVVFIFVGG